MRDELAIVLRLVAEGRITPAEAAPLIEALSGASGRAPSGPGPEADPERGSFPPKPPVPGSDPRLLKGALTDQAMSGVEDELFTTGARWNLRLRTHRRPRRFDA